MARVPTAVASPAFAELARRQDSVLSRPQLLGLKVHRHHIARQVTAGRWQAVGPHVVVLHNGPLSPRQRLWVAVLHGGRGAALAALTAAVEHGLKGFESPVLHVVVPKGSNRADLDHAQIRVKVRETRRLGADDLHPTRRPRMTRVARSIVDAASTASSDGRCRAVLAASVQQRIVRAAVLRSEAASRPTLPRRALILETVDDVEGGSHSLPEMEWLRGLRRVGLPEPTRQRVIQRADGRYYLDAEFDPFAVTAEINGAQHLDLLIKEADDLRRTRLSISGRLMVDLGSYTVRHDNDLAMLVTADALMSRGWQPSRACLRRLQRMAAGRRDFSWTTKAA